MAGKPKLNERRTKFISAYLETLNASEAARQAGYKDRANQAGYQLLTNTDIQAIISQELKTRMDADRESVKARVLSLWNAVSTTSTESMRDRLKASELLAKYAGLLTERLEITGKDGAPIEYIKLPETAKE
jgi:phage terminase small subunit